jgi:DNA ligase-1
MDLHKNPVLQARFDKPEYFGFDSEGIVGDPLASNCISVSSGGFSRQKDKPKEGKFVDVPAHFFVFDDFTHPALPYIERYKRAQIRVQELKRLNPDSPFQMANMHVVHNKDELLALWDQADDEGHEGLIGRSLNAPYKFGRATPKEMSFLRFKRFEEREFVITGYEEGETNTNEAKKNSLGQTERSSAKAGMVPNGEIGAFLGHDLETKQPIKVAAGKLTKKEAIEGHLNFAELYLNQIGKYKVFNKGTGNFTKPRFPTFQCLRSKEDMS